jgi:hypothetical protein
MDGRLAEDETVVAVHVADLVSLGTYQTALGPPCQNSPRPTSVIVTESMLWSFTVSRIGRGAEAGELGCLSRPRGNAGLSVSGNHF